jgi:DNA-binding IclR family transcriptional regulator
MPGSDLVQSLARGLDLLRLFAESEGALRLPDIMSVTGLKRPTLHNLLRTLASSDFVVKDGNEYRLGPAVVKLAAEDISSRRLRDAEQAVCILATRLPDAIVSFSEPLGGDILVRFRQFPDRLLMERNSGAVLAPYQTASGLAVLAFGNVETRHAIALKHPFQLSGLASWGTEAHLEEYLCEARDAGHVLPPFSRGSNFKVAAVPCLSDSGELCGVFGAAWHGGSAVGDPDAETVFCALHEAAENKELTKR